MASRTPKFIQGRYKLGQRRCPICSCQLVYNPNQKGKTQPKNSATFEHLVPKSQGGTRDSRNGMMVCKQCNLERGNQCWVRWIEQLNPPKKQYLLNKYYEAVAYHMSIKRNITIRNKVKVYVENLTVNFN